MASITTTNRLGRQLWTSIRDSVDILLPLRPGSHRRLMNRPDLTQISVHSAQLFPRRAFHVNRSLLSPGCPKLSKGSVRRSCTSGGLLLLGLSSNSSSAPGVVATCTAAADTALVATTFQKATFSSLARQTWRRNAQIRSQSSQNGVRKRSASSKPGGDGEKSALPQDKTGGHKPATDPSHPPEHESLVESVSKYMNSHLPKMPHRPTRDELLAAATGFWQRLRVRFKWFSIRSMRPWNVDEWGAFVSLFVLGHLVWILVGTTAFFSLVIYTINTSVGQETLAKWIGDYLTQSAGVTVIFESAIVPKWRDGVITLKNVFVSRRPGQIKSSVKKGSPDAAAEAAALRKADQDTSISEEDDGNYTQFDITMNTVNVTLSFVKWWNGKGLLKDVEIKGVRGVVDRTSVVWSSENIDPLTFRHEHSPGDFELEHFRMEDLLVTVHQPGGFRPFPISIYSCELPQLRKQWLFYDVLSASHMSGSFDGSLFTIHPRQMAGVAAADDTGGEADDAPLWKKFSRLRIDGLKIDHLNRNDPGPFGWIHEGNVDIVADVMFPAEADESIGKVMAEFYDKMEEAVTSNRYIRLLESNGTWAGREAGEQEPLQVMDLRVHLNDVRAAVPFRNSHISYVNQALVRPIVAYINTKRTYIPIACRIVKRASDFDGAWSVYDCGMMDDLGAEVYSAFARDVEDQQSRVRRFKRVGLWTVSLVVHALLAGVAGDLM